MESSGGRRRRNTSMGPALSCNPARKKRKKSIRPPLSQGTRCLRKNITHRNCNICITDCMAVFVFTDRPRHTKFQSETCQGRDFFENLNVDGKIIFIWI
jgi:hypothetical protein